MIYGICKYMHVSMYVKIKNINEYNTYMIYILIYIYNPPFQTPPQKKKHKTRICFIQPAFQPPFFSLLHGPKLSQAFAAKDVFMHRAWQFFRWRKPFFLFTLEATYIPGTSGKPMLRNKFPMQCGVTFGCVVGNFRMCCGASYCMCGDIPKN